MDAAMGTRLVGAVNSLGKKIDDLNKTIRQTAQASFSNNSNDVIVIASVPIELDWCVPSVHGIAQITKDALGRVDIHVILDQVASDRVDDVLHHSGVEALQLSNVDPKS